MVTVNFKFNTGDMVKEKITGFKGVIMNCALYSTGCKHYGVQSSSLDKDGKPSEWQFFDESRLELVKADVFKKDEEESKKRPSGPFQNPPQA